MTCFDVTTLPPHSGGDAKVSVLAKCGLLSLLCYLVVVSRIVIDRIQAFIHANAVTDPSIPPSPSIARRRGMSAYSWFREVVESTIARASLNVRILITVHHPALARRFLRPEDKLHDAFIIQLWQLRHLQRINIAVEAALHTCGTILFFYGMSLVFGQTAWFSYLLFEVGPAGHGQLEFVGLTFSVTLFFWVLPEVMTLFKANVLHALLLAGCFAILESEVSYGVRTFTFACVLRVTLGFVFANLPYTLFINFLCAVLRAFHDEGEMESASNLPERYMATIKTELLTIYATCAAVYVAESQIHEAVCNIADSRMARRSESATKHLLSLLCDAAFYLGPELRLQAHSHELAALLLREGGRSLEGCDFEELIQPVDRARFNNYIEEAVQRTLDQGPRDDGEDSFDIGRFLEVDIQSESVDSARAGYSMTRRSRFQDPLVLHLKAASSTSVCVEIFHIVNRDMNERVMHLIGLRELQGTNRRNVSVIRELPLPEHMLFPLSESSSQLPEERSPSKAARDSPTQMRNLASLRGISLQGRGSDNVDRRSTVSSSSGGSSCESGITNQSDSCDDTDRNIQIETVDLQAEDGEDLIAVWVDALSPNLPLLRTTTGFAKLGRPFRQGDSLLGFLVSDSCKVMSRIKKHVDYAKEDCTLYTEEGPEPCHLGKLRFRLSYTLAEVTADCRLQLQPVPGGSDSDSERGARNKSVLEARILLQSVKQSKARREKRPRKEKSVLASIPQGGTSSKLEHT